MVYVVHPKLLGTCQGDIKISYLPGVFYPKEYKLYVIEFYVAMLWLRLMEISF